MRDSIAGAAIFLAGAGATTALAVTSGNNLALNGSDALYDVTKDVISACGVQFPGGTGFGTKGITYNGGGSYVGVVEMELGAQEIAPMARAMRSNEYCGFSTGNAADLLIGLDGISIVTSKTSSCSAATVNQVGNMSFTYSGGTYTLGAVSVIPASIDALRILYTGVDQNGVANCGSDLRRALIQNWRNLFTTDPSCAGGDGHCTSGLTHAWRLADVSGTSDSFLDILQAHNKGAPSGRATMMTVGSGETQGFDPFCNSFERNDPNHQAQFLDGTALLSDGVTTTPMSDGRVNDQEDHDPLRTPCDGNDALCGSAGQCFKQTTQATCLATSAQCTWNGASCESTNDLGVVLPVFIPDVAYGTTELYPTNDCSGSCSLLPIIAAAPFRSATNARTARTRSAAAAGCPSSTRRDRIPAAS